LFNVLHKTGVYTCAVTGAGVTAILVTIVATNVYDSYAYPNKPVEVNREGQLPPVAEKKSD